MTPQFIHGVMILRLLSVDQCLTGKNRFISILSTRCRKYDSIRVSIRCGKCQFLFDHTTPQIARLHTGSYMIDLLRKRR